MLFPVFSVENCAADQEPNQYQNPAFEQQVARDRIAHQENIREPLKPAVAHFWNLAGHEQDQEQSDKMYQGSAPKREQSRCDRGNKQKKENNGQTAQGIPDAVPKIDKTDRQQNTKDSNSHRTVFRTKGSGSRCNQKHGKSYNQKGPDKCDPIDPETLFLRIGRTDFLL